MADGFDDYNADFATPNQIAAQRAYAAALLHNSLNAPTGTSGNVTAASPWGAVASMAQALSGQMGLRQAANQERQSAIGGGNIMAQQSSYPGQPPSTPYASSLPLNPQGAPHSASF